MKSLSAPPELSDPELVALARRGDQAAYGQLVARHQTLVASLAYSICGDFTRSRDLAQEAFVIAWRQLGTLDEPTKFKSWLCGIARNLGYNFVRAQTRRPDRPLASHDATSHVEPTCDTPTPREHAVTREESLLVWRALEQLPENYREPLILFYREQHSVERVAAALDLSENTVRQRLSRGRGLLREQMEGMIDRTLAFTTPGMLFTTTVIGSLATLASPMIAASAVVSTSAAAKGGAATTLGTLLKPLAGFSIIPLLGLISAWFARRDWLRLAHTPADRAFVNLFWVWAGLFVLLGPAGMVAALGWIITHPEFTPNAFTRFFLSMWPPITAASFALLILWAWRPFLAWGRRVLQQDPASNQRAVFATDRARIYRSRFTFLGLPLVDIRFGHSVAEPHLRGTARGWIALGDVAHGIVLAVGGVAIGGIAVGGIALGIVSVSYVAFGAVAFGGVAAGGLAHGFIAVGYSAYGMLAVGYAGAFGMVAIARHFAYGLFFAFAEQTGIAALKLMSTNLLNWMGFQSGIWIIAFLLGELTGVIHNWRVRRPAPEYFIPAPQTPRPPASRSGA